MSAHGDVYIVHVVYSILYHKFIVVSKHFGTRKLMVITVIVFDAARMEP